MINTYVTKRNYSIDLLKCLSMLMVIILHLKSYGLRSVEYNPYSAVGITSSLLQSFSIVGVNVFVLITGYFSSGKIVSISKESLLGQYKRLIPLWIQVEMYSIGIYLILCAIPQSGIKFTIQQLIKQSFPVLTNQYWFFSEYFLLVLIAPFINVLIHKLNQKEYQCLLIVLLGTFSIIPTINIFGESLGTEYGFSLLWFVVLYTIGGYIRNYKIKSRRYGWIYLLFVVGFFICHLLSNVVLGIVSSFLNLFSNTYTSIFVLAATVSIFLAFLNSKQQYKRTGKIITVSSSLSFAIYLIHEHNSFRDFLWGRLVNLSKYNTGLCLLVMLASVICIYLLSVFIEFIRVKLVGMITNVLKRVIIPPQ